jgi:hypothetical protein
MNHETETTRHDIVMSEQRISTFVVLSFSKDELTVNEGKQSICDHHLQ